MVGHNLYSLFRKKMSYFRQNVVTKFVKIYHFLRNLFLRWLLLCKLQLLKYYLDEMCYGEPWNFFELVAYAPTLFKNYYFIGHSVPWEFLKLEIQTVPFLRIHTAFLNFRIYEILVSLQKFLIFFCLKYVFTDKKS
jgi:hypothetical protein